MKRLLVPLLVLSCLLSACASANRPVTRSSQIMDASDLTRSGPQPDYSGQGGAHSQMFTPPPSTSSSSSSP